jgi:hypothetical protein
MRRIPMVVLLALAALGAAAQPARPLVEKVAEGQYRIGRIEVDQTAGRFTVPGKVLRREPPLEFLAVARQGPKGYESLLELDAGARELNVACIVIGLDAEAATLPRHHFDPRLVEGDPVAVRVVWEVDGETREVGAAELLEVGEGAPVADEWVYTGSRFTPDGRYLAEMDGTVIGFVHDGASIIEHRTGLGLGDYGAVRVREGLLPPPGTPVRVTVERRGE